MDSSELLRRRAPALIAAALLGLVLGWILGRAPPGLPNADTFRPNPGQVLSATINSLKAENKLVVYRYTGEAHVSRTDTYMGFLKANQDLSVPASVTYFIDMDEFGPEDVRYDEKAKTVEIALPKLKTGDIAFAPERARQFNRGWITVSNDIVEALAKSNYATARAAFANQAQNPPLVQSAKEQAIKAVTAQFEVPLRAVGLTDVRVRTYFP